MMQAPTIAIVGSGPAGCYLAQNLRRSLPEAQINVFERLVSPFGLVRYGVAPDHQSTKSVQAQFERLFDRGGADFYGNVDIGSDISLDELRSAHTVVILATGLYTDRRLGLNGEDLPNVHRSGPITRLFNSHPLERSDFPRLGRALGIIGGGNVSIDLVRMLAKQTSDFAGSDVDPLVLEEYARAPVSTISWICRAPIERVPLDPAMLTELGSIDGVSLTCTDGLEVAEGADRTVRARAAAIRALVDAGHRADDRVRIELLLGWETVGLVGDDRVTAVRVRRGDEVREVPVDSIITAIGFDFAETDGLGTGPLTADSDAGRLAPGLFRTGWLRRGSHGTIAENRRCAKTVATAVAASLADFVGDDKAGIEALPRELIAQSVGYDGWRLVAARETESAEPDRVRHKIRRHEEMVGVARSQTSIGHHEE